MNMAQFPPKCKMERAGGISFGGFVAGFAVKHLLNGSRGGLCHFAVLASILGKRPLYGA